jgi:hypothetical protein
MSSRSDQQLKRDPKLPVFWLAFSLAYLLVSQVREESADTIEQVDNLRRIGNMSSSYQIRQRSKTRTASPPCLMLLVRLAAEVFF